MQWRIDSTKARAMYVTGTLDEAVHAACQVCGCPRGDVTLWLLPADVW